MNSVKGTISFIFLSLGFYFLLMFVMSKVKYNGSSIIIQTNDFYFQKGGDTYTKFNDFEKNELHDIVFVGSSRCYRHYNPQFFGGEELKSWNLGTSAQIMRNSKIVIEGYLNNTNCRTIVLDLFPAAFNTPGLESSADLITNLSETEVAFHVGLEMADSRALNLIVNRTFTNYYPPSFESDDYLGKGFCAHLDTIKEDAVYNENKEIADLEINQDQLGVLQEIIDYCEDEKIELILVISPTSNYFPVKTYHELLEIITPVIEQNNIPFFDYGKSLPIYTTQHFYDESHLNISGVEIFNKTFYQDLLKANLIHQYEP